MSRRSWIAVAVVLTLVLPVAASGAAPLTVAQYRAQANAICTSDGKQIDALSSHLTLAQFLVAAEKITHKAYNSLKLLSPPASFASYHAQLLAVDENGFSILDGLIARAKAGKLTISQFRADKSFAANAKAEDALWRKIGATVCE